MFLGNGIGTLNPKLELHDIDFKVLPSLMTFWISEGGLKILEIREGDNILNFSFQFSQTAVWAAFGHDANRFT